MEKAKVRQEEAKKGQKTCADRHKRHVEFQEGEQVLLNSRNLNLEHPWSRKLFPSWIGPLIVERCIGLEAYQLTLPDSMDIEH